jgi:hypothetical protein
MKLQKLQVWSRDQQEKVAEFVWEDGKTMIVMCKFENDAKKWIEFGLDEWIGPLGEQTPRHTASTDYIFLERVGSYLKRTTGFIVTLSELEAFVE